MSESDAEWFDPPSPSGPNSPAGPNNPPPRPTTPAFRPNGGRRRCLDPPCRRRDAPDIYPPSASGSNQTMIIVVSVVSTLIFIALLLLLLYMFVLRKKLRKIKQHNSNSQYGMRVEDVAHLNIDDSAKLYVNTTDLQKLVSSIRIKEKKPPPPVPLPSSHDEGYRDVIRVERPPAPLPGNDQMYNGIPAVDLAKSPKSPVQIYANISENFPTTIAPVRPAPSLPSSDPGNRNLESGTLLQENPTKNTLSKPSPLLLPKPTSPHLKTEPVGEGISQMFPVQKHKTKSPSTAILMSRVLPPPVPAPTSKPTLEKAQQTRPILPPLKINLIPSVNRQDSGFSTPDTAISYVAEEETAADTPSSESRTLSVKERKAMLVGIIRQ